MSWIKTSRNTYVKIVNNYQDSYIFKKSDLITKDNYYDLIESYVKLNEISGNSDLFEAPKVILEKSSYPVICLEYIDGKSIHDLFKEDSDSIENLIVVISNILDQFHDLTKSDDVKDYCLLYKDFGPKNIIFSRERFYLIDPPDQFIFGDYKIDIGVFVFETIRCLIQARRYNNVLSAYRTMKFHFKNKYSFCFFLRHSFAVKMRYIKIWKKSFNTLNIIKFLFLPFFLLILDISIGLYDVYLATRE